MNPHAWGFVPARTSTPAFVLRVGAAHAGLGGDLCRDLDRDGCCDRCGVMLERCVWCHGVGYHRRGCDLIEG